jgi:hypothetical protein
VAEVEEAKKQRSKERREEVKIEENGRSMLRPYKLLLKAVARSKTRASGLQLTNSSHYENMVNNAHS